MKKILLSVALSIAAGLAVAADRPYDEAADAKAQIAAALHEAAAAREPVLLIFGANWCKDCRALDHGLRAAAMPS